MFCAPLNGASNKIAKVRVNVLPDDVTPDPTPFTVHWLFVSVPDAPRPKGVEKDDPALLASANVPCTGSTEILQALTLLVLVLNRAWREVRSAAPLGSEKTKVNVWLLPVPAAGVTETAWGAGGGGVTNPSRITHPVLPPL